MTYGWTFAGRWQSDAACAGVDPQVFHDLGTATKRDHAKTICKGCPVRSECLAHALESPWEPSGIWGGLSQGQISRIWRAQHPLTSPTERHNEITTLIGLIV